MTAPVSLPASCEVEALAEWLYETAQAAHPRGTPGFRETPWDRLGPDGRQQTRETARAVRALVEAKVREAVMETAGVAVYLGMGDDGRPEYDMERVDGVVSRVLGSAS